MQELFTAYRFAISLAVRLPNGLPGRPEGLPLWPRLNGLPTTCLVHSCCFMLLMRLGEEWRGFAINMVKMPQVLRKTWPPMRCADRSWLPAKGALALAFDERIQKDLANVL